MDRTKERRDRRHVFPSTRWTLIERAGDGRAHVRRLALEELLRLYWPALQAHLRRRGQLIPERTDDLLQGFVCDKIVEQGLLAHCERGAGRFRSFLLTLLDRYLVDQYRRENARCRAPDHASPGQEMQLDAEPAAVGDPATDFDVAWARETIGEAIRRTRQECHESGRQDIWAVLSGRLLGPALEGARVVAYEEVATALRIDVRQSANLLTTGKRMFQRKLRDVVCLYATDDREIGQEIADVQRILTGRRTAGVGGVR